MTAKALVRRTRDEEPDRCGFSFLSSSSLQPEESCWHSSSGWNSSSGSRKELGRIFGFFRMGAKSDIWVWRYFTFAKMYWPSPFPGLSLSHLALSKPCLDPEPVLTDGVEPLLVRLRLTFGRAGSRQGCAGVEPLLTDGVEFICTSFGRAAPSASASLTYGLGATLVLVPLPLTLGGAGYRELSPSCKLCSVFMCLFAV